jgi:NAD(P)-dependent dehydrogenase (short-subunit alcohol dehydrogenase family)
VSEILRQGLLSGQTVLVSGPDAGPLGAASALCDQLGATVVDVAETETLDTIVVEGRLPAGDDADAALVTALGEVWDVVHAAANAALIPRERGKIVLIGPRPDGGVHAQALRDGLENMARTLSIEWARYGILPTMIAPGARTADEEVATLVGYLASPAGDYYSGCRFELGSVSL